MMAKKTPAKLIKDIAHQRGDVELEQAWPRPVDVKAIRKCVKMSQAEFPRAYGIGKRALAGMGVRWASSGFSRLRLPDSDRERAGRRPKRPRLRLDWLLPVFPPKR